MVLVSCRNRAFAMLPRAAKHLERAKQLVCNWILLPAFGPRKRKFRTGPADPALQAGEEVALLQGKDFPKTHIQMCPLALLHGRSHGPDSVCASLPQTSERCQACSHLSAPRSLTPPEAVCCSGLPPAKNLCYRVTSSCPPF